MKNKFDQPIDGEEKEEKTDLPNEKEKVTEEKKEEEIKENLNQAVGGFKKFLYELLDIRHDTDRKGTIEDVKAGIPMKGHTAWILVFSILIASIGLNANSTAVVIGAMLISPLMGPILGIGLSIGINDIDTLRRSFVNLGVMVALSLITSFLFFSIPLFQEFTPQLQARTVPDVRDVFIALSGGLALIVALSRRSKQTNTIAGVAIATALMPPLCTAGYGLAVGNFKYFGNAIFLFTINTIFIAIATFMIVKFLRFPMVKYINSVKRKRISQLASFVAVLIFSFSIFSFYQLYQRNQFQKAATSFIEGLKKKGVYFLNTDAENISYSDKSITIFPFGEVTEKQEIRWAKKMKKDPYLAEVDLFVENTSGGAGIKKLEQATNIINQNQKLLLSKEEQIIQKDQEIFELQKIVTLYQQKEAEYEKIISASKNFMTGVSKVSLSNKYISNFVSVDTIPSIEIIRYDTVKVVDKNGEDLKMKNYIKETFKNKAVEVIIK